MNAAPPLRLALVGFGSVGRRFVELLAGPYGRVLGRAGARATITGIATARHGIAIDADGLSARRCLGLVRRGASLDALHKGERVVSVRRFIERVPADVLIELTPLNPQTGQPAVSHVRQALSRGLHVITANKGPVAFALAPLRRLAARRGRRFLYEGTVMDGVPVFNLVERCLPGARITGFRGVLNCTTSRILARMEEGGSAAEALREVQAAGIAEADPKNDIDGWDAAVKGCAVANALMGAMVRPRQVRRRGIGDVSAADVRRATRSGRRVRLVVRGARVGRGVRVSVAPEALPADDLLVSRGCDGVLVLETDLMREVGIWEGSGGVDQTAFAVLSDLVAVARTRSASAVRGTVSSFRGEY